AAPCDARDHDPAVRSGLDPDVVRVPEAVGSGGVGLQDRLPRGPDVRTRRAAEDAVARRGIDRPVSIERDAGDHRAVELGPTDLLPRLAAVLRTEDADA